MSPSILASEICSGPSTSNAGIRYVVLAILQTFANANNMSDTISGSSNDQSNRAVNQHKSRPPYISHGLAYVIL